MTLAATLDSCRRRSSTPSAAWAAIVRTGTANLAWLSHPSRKNVI